MHREIISDIVAEMRELAADIEYGNAVVGQTVWRNYADRIEAAAKRETVGNMSAMREALVKCREIALQWEADEAAGVAGTTDKPESRSAAEAVIDMEFEINAALAAPPRNCDRYSHDEALSVWAAEKENGKNGCFDEWLYAPAKEGGDNA